VNKVTKRTGSPEEKKPQKLTKRQLQARETKNKIYSSAVKIINQKGYNNVSIEDITSDANVAKGSFYTYFESKEALVFYTFKQSDEVYEKAFAKVEDETFPDMVIHFVKMSYQEYEKRGKGIIKAMVSNYFSFPDYNFYSEDRMLLQCMRRIVTKGKEQGALAADVSTKKYVNMLLSTLIGVEVMWCLDDQSNSLADMIEDAVKITASGMMKTTENLNNN
jgi:AcrR family transcriptional regulator